MTTGAPLRSVAEAQAENRAIMEDLESKGEDAFEELLPLTSEDCKIIGFIVQSFAYADLNGRRALEIIDHLRKASAPSVNKTLRDNQVLATLREQVSELELSREELRDVDTALGMLDRFAPIRHHFAHWAARRHPSKDVIVAMTMNAREAFRRAGHEPQRFKATFALVPMPEVRANLAALEKNTDYIASRVADWWQRFMPANMK